FAPPQLHCNRLGLGVEFSGFVVNQAVLRGFYGNSGVKSFLALLKTLALYGHTQLRKCPLKSLPKQA
ncbi:MAG: hypothetical protein OXG10_02700, partial [Candidatus Dadabacteria bacterium]|nr:hypothetical protein [Candidatus Dadabacteria bacterium]